MDFIQIIWMLHKPLIQITVFNIASHFSDVPKYINKPEQETKGHI